MDPLSAVASVLGIITAAAQAATILAPYVNASAETPIIAAQLHSETLATKAILQALQKLATNIDASIPSMRYASLIQVDELRAILTDGVLLFSGLESLLNTLPPAEPPTQGARVLSSIQWARKRGALTTLFNRLQAFKMSVTCILSILQSDSQVRAESHQQALVSSVAQLLKSNQTLTRLLMARDDTGSIPDTTSKRRPSMHTIRTLDDLDETPSSNPRASIASFRSLYTLHFEKELNSSWVYRRAKKRHGSIDPTIGRSSTSLASSAFDQGWSIFSGMSLSDISDVSVLALPIYPSDIANPQHYNFKSGPGAGRRYGPAMSAVYTTDVRSLCALVEQHLSRAKSYPFAELIAEERSATAAEKGGSPLSVLVAVFQRGLPLLAILDCFHDALHPGWDDLLDSNMSSFKAIAQLAATRFVRACVGHLEVKPSECFTVSDLMSRSRPRHVKVLRVVLRLLERLDLEEPQEDEELDRDDKKPTPSEAHGMRVSIVDKFLEDEWQYINGLQSLVAINDGTLATDAMGGVEDGIAPAGEFDRQKERRKWTRLFGEIRYLVDAHTELMWRVRMVDMVPSAHQGKRFGRIMADWSVRASACYAGFLCPQRHGESSLGWPVTFIMQGKRVVNTACVMLTRAETRTRQYHRFLEQMRREGGLDGLGEAFEQVQMVERICSENGCAKPEKPEARPAMNPTLALKSTEHLAIQIDASSDSDLFGQEMQRVLDGLGSVACS